MNGETLQAALAPLPPERVLAVVGNVVDADLAAKAVADAVARVSAPCTGWSITPASRGRR